VEDGHAGIGMKMGDENVLFYVEEKKKGRQFNK
jgi:hypothetical protein